MEQRQVYLILLFVGCFTMCEAADVTPWNGRSLLSIFDAITGACPQGPQETVTEETMLNHHNWWEQNWGRTDSTWPRRGTSECWANRGTVCALPEQDHVVCLPGSRRGSTISKGWALDPKGQACKPGVHCLYACEPGYYWTTFNQAETSNYDQINAQPRGHCDGTWNYGTSTHGVYCREDGTLELPPQPLCQLGETYVYAENQLDTHVFLCQTVFPGHEIFLIPTLIRPGESIMITTQPVDFWHGPTYSKPTHGDFYVSFAGADIMEACTWDEFSPSGAALLPYEIGSGVEDNGVVYSTHYFYQQPNSEVPATKVGYTLDIECESSEPGVCGPVFRNANVVKADVLRRPIQEGSTRVKFVFRKPEVPSQYGDMYIEPAQPHFQDISTITGISRSGTSYTAPVTYLPSDPSSQASGDPQSYFYNPQDQDTVVPSDQAQATATSIATTTSTSDSEGYTGTESSGAVTDNQAASDYHPEYSATPTFRPDFTSEGQDNSEYTESTSATTTDASATTTEPATSESTVSNTDPNADSTATSTVYTSTSGGRRLMESKEDSRVFLHNTLPTAIVICAGDGRRSSRRGISVGPGEKFQLDSDASYKINTKTDSGSCQDTDGHWHISTGNQTATQRTYTYIQTDAHQGYRMTLKCVSEEDSCTALDANSVSAVSSHEVTFIVKPSDLQSSKRSLTWGDAVHKLFVNFLRFPSS